MVTENIRDMPNLDYFMKLSRDSKWVNKVCPHCIYTTDCEKSDSECGKRGGFMYKLGASDSENKKYIEKNIGLEMR